MYQSAYLVGLLFFGVLWMWFFYARKDLRRQMLVASIITMPLAPITQILWFYHDYWRPEYIVSYELFGVPLGIEEPLFAFFIGGVATVSYEVLLRRKRSCGKPRTGEALLVVFLTLLIIGGLKFFGVNTIWASIIGLLVGSLIIMVRDRDLITDCLLSGVAMTVLSILIYLAILGIYPEFIQRFWVQDGLTGINLFGIPIEEILWFLSWGAFAGVIYEFRINVERYTPYQKPQTVPLDKRR